MKNIDLKTLAEMAELADALDSGSSPRKGVEVRVLFSAFPSKSYEHNGHLQKSVPLRKRCDESSRPRRKRGNPIL